MVRKQLLLFSVVLVAFAVFFSKADAQDEQDPEDIQDLDESWKAFKVKFNKNYDEKEDAKRKKIYEDNLNKIREHNKKFEAGESKYKQGVNKFADQEAGEVPTGLLPSKGK